MDLLLQVHYKEKNNPDVETSRFINILLNTLTKKEYTKLRILFYILSIISIIALIYFMWIMNNIIISIVVIIGICIITYTMLNLKKLVIKSALKYYLQGQLSKTPRAFILNFYKDSIEIKFDDENSLRLVYSLIEKIYETTDIFFITDITWISKSQLSKEEIGDIKDILKTKFTDKYIEFN
ncbi:hypothetical protein [Clostridium sp. UBA4395]|uniref:hypothetical protein n=1 Tax=Clostridium sp. UBA4395 TaxID=1946360 RepID=UPI0032171669